MDDSDETTLSTSAFQILAATGKAQLPVVEYAVLLVDLFILMQCSISA